MVLFRLVCLIISIIGVTFVLGGVWFSLELGALGIGLSLVGLAGLSSPNF